MKPRRVAAVASTMGLLWTLFGFGSARAELLKVGDIAPPFATQAIENGQTVPIRLSDFLGRKVVLYFYPKDNTPGCTKEACAFRDGYAMLARWGIAVLGCSVDSESSHRAFQQKYKLPFPLLLDPDKSIAKAYGVDNGIPILGLDKRVTYVIGTDGRILKVYPNVDPAIHAGQIIQDLGADKEPPPTPALAPQPSAPAASATPPSRDHGDDSIE
jgi:peroxiredoxin Q/BCP